jgi:glycolate dehydrogenase iron-sulfur subunit
MRAAPVPEKPSEAEYLNCIRCGLCLSVCPTYRETLSETASPRGRVVLARKGLEGDLELTPNLIEQMYACMDCMACNDICPVGLRPAELALSMRHVQEQLRPAAWKRPLFEGLIPRPGRLEAATLPLRLYQSLGIRDAVYALGLRRLLPNQLRDVEAMLPHLPRRPLRPHLPEVVQAVGQARYRVGFFLGCAQSLLFSDDSAAALRVLARNGSTVYTPREIVCCGMPARGFGRLDLARDQARRNIAAFEQGHVDVIVTDCATCGSTLKEYGALLAEDAAWAGRAAAFSRQVRDISEFLAGIPLERPRGQIRERVTYHDPCHLRRAQHVWQEPRHLLSLIDGLEYVELPEADWCCGSAGSQLISHYETSLRILRRKIDHVAETEATVVASGCPGCQMQLTTGIRRRGLPVRVAHPVTLLARAYEESHED